VSTDPAVLLDVILRDGQTLRLRAPVASDRDALVAFLEDLSPDSRQMRFHGTLRPGARLIEGDLEPDWSEHGALIGSLVQEGREHVVALASYARLRDPSAAEVAFAVANRLQGLGVGTRLLEQLARRASAAGIERLIFEILTRNAGMLAVVAGAGFAVTQRRLGGVIEATMSIEPTGESLARRDERDHVAVAASLRHFLEPSSLAVIGASARRGTIGGELFRNVVAAGFRGPAHPVNRSGEEVAGVPAAASVRAIEGAVDLAVICVPADAVLAAATDALEGGVRALCVISAGFAEVGAEGAARQQQLLALVRSYGGRMIGPNCLGVASTPALLNATFAASALPPGSVGFASQSGALGLAAVEQARGRGLGLSSFVSLGNKADVSSNDLLEYWEDDDGTNVVALYLESFGNPERFSRIARRVARRKPVLALKGGVSAAGARAAASHTAALASSEAAVEALFHQAGVQRMRTLSELLDAAALLSSQPLPAGPRVTVLTNAGGLGILCADACEAEGLQLPEPEPATRDRLAAVVPAEASLRNPIDLLGSATGTTFAAALGPLLVDPEVDSICVLFVRPAIARTEDVAKAVEAALTAAGDHGKTVTGVFLSAEPLVGGTAPSRLATFSSPEAAARALGVGVRRAAWLRRPEGRVPALGGIDRATARAVARAALNGVDDAWLGADASRRLLEAYGIRLVGEALADDPEAAATAASELGFPVVVKTAEPGAHKTESGGVVLDLRDAAAVREAAAGIGGAVLVQSMSEGAELLAGVVRDPIFGPIVALGLGGVLAELVDAVTFRIAPLTDLDAAELVAARPVRRLVAGFRGRPPLDEAALLDLLHRLSALATDVPEVAELDLNPVLARADGYVAVDRRVRVRRVDPDVRAKTW
jgi:acyl-CoA synthetase (NDP forming)/RimJ/RimL family protein N-acetyltransferase